MGASGVSIQTKIARGGDVRPLYWCVSVAWLATLTWLVAREAPEILRAAPTLLAWTILLAVLNLLPVSGWGSAHFTVDLPVSIAAALVLPPAQTALVASLGAFDPRELRADTSLDRALFNRSHVGLGAYLGSLCTHAITMSPGMSRLVVPLGFLALSIASVLNYTLVATALSVARGDPVQKVLRSMRLGTLQDFLLTFLAWGVMGAMLATLYVHIQSFALLAFLGPGLLSRQVLLRSEMWKEVNRAYEARQEALVQLSGQIAAERTDERRLIAADLHDEVLQPLFKVALMSHVLKADLAAGRLLEMDDDLPELLTAAEMASGTLRELIGDLRRSGLGRGGLAPSLSNLVRRLQIETKIELVPKISIVETDSASQIALYQIAKEAITNAIQHAGAEVITIVLSKGQDIICLEVTDDGAGFDPEIECTGHFGLSIMRERAAGVMGTLIIDSNPGLGTTVKALVPA